MIITSNREIPRVRRLDRGIATVLAFVDNLMPADCTDVSSTSPRRALRQRPLLRQPLLHVDCEHGRAFQVLRDAEPDVAAAPAHCEVISRQSSAA
jgi:hypothetical protein